MKTVFLIIVSFMFGYSLGVIFEKRRSSKLIKEAFMIGYRECNNKWKKCNNEEIRKRLARRKVNGEN